MKMQITPCQINPKTFNEHRKKGDIHIKAFDLGNGYQLHRFVNCVGVGYSAIYAENGDELLSHERLFESRMLEIFKRQRRTGILK